MRRLFRPRLLAPVLLVALTAFTALPVVAGVVQLPVRELVRKSYAVVRADVVATTSAYGPWYNGGEVILTTATVRVTDVLHGESGGTVDVTLLGGTVGGRTMTASGCPTLAAGEDVVLFLLAHEGKSWVTGLDNGKYAVVGNEAVNQGCQTARRLPLESLAAEITEAAAGLADER